MLNYDRIARQLDGLVISAEGLSMLQHFDYPETWSYSGNTTLSTSAKFGKNCAYFADTTSKTAVTNTTGMFNLSPFGEYEAECFVKASLPPSGCVYYNGHTFRLSDTSATWSDAKTECEALGGHLATSTSAEKNELLKTLAGTNAWLGGTNNGTVGAWAWDNGETWDYTNWADGQPSLETEGTDDHVALTSSGEWLDVVSSTFSYPYICEWDRETADSLIDFGGLSLNLTYDGRLQLTSDAWNILKASSTALEAGIWQHILLRITGGCAYVFIDGVQVLKAGITGTGAITPERVTLGGYVGYMDEFAFRRNAGTEAPEVPTTAYEMGVVTIERVPTVNAPVTRAVWSAEGLPDGLSLSESGVLTGHPTTAGSYESTVTVTTNWGTATKTIGIVIE